jgi:hypothetical protein
MTCFKRDLLLKRVAVFAGLEAPSLLPGRCTDGESESQESWILSLLRDTPSDLLGVIIFASADELQSLATDVRSMIPGRVAKTSSSAETPVSGISCMLSYLRELKVLLNVSKGGVEAPEDGIHCGASPNSSVVPQ